MNIRCSLPCLMLAVIGACLPDVAIADFTFYNGEPGFDMATFTGDIAPPLVDDDDISYTHSDANLTFRTPTSGIFSARFSNEDRTISAVETGKFTIELLP